MKRPLCGLPTCECKHLPPCDHGWIESEQTRDRYVIDPADGKSTVDGTITVTIAQRCPQCAPPAAVPVRQYGPAEPDRQYSSPGWQGYRADLE